MELHSNESSPSSQYDKHEARITVLEKAVVDLHCDIALLRQHMDAGFASLHAEIEHTADKLRLEFHESQQLLYEKISRELKEVDERTTQRIDRLEAKLDYFIKWVIGMQLTTMGGLIALAAHQYM
ncbi:hypothetical protein [Pseudoduganella violacea]|uniref:DUF1640 domain-containing protein n=1 Tax=Pseudoduganella violacea TaxID=1715466 RepID=A0A7W5B921_9BURK|nr:hypothetical protein [Pseudoduganella violacea]MBB3118771.1 hypothetical protein [Pseudoduganella violacea]